MESRVVLIAGSPPEHMLALADLTDRLLRELELDLHSVIVNEDTGQDAAEALRQHRPLGLVLFAKGLSLRRALLGVATFNRDLIILLATEADPQSLGEADVLARLYRLRRMVRVEGWPTVADMTGFLFRAGRHGNIGRLIPVSG